MRHFVRKHKKKIIVGHGVVTVLFLLSTALLLSEDDAVLFMTPNGSEVLPLRETVDIDVNVTTKIPLNAVGATIAYPADILDVIGISKKKSFLDLWTEDTIIRNESGEVIFSGGTLREGGLIGTGTIFTFTVRAKKTGEATVELRNTQALAGDGKGTAIQHVARTVKFIIPESTIAALPAESGDSTASIRTTYGVIGDVDGDGTVSISDMSTLLVHILMPYDSKYDLNTDGAVTISDLSIVLSML